MIQTAKKAEVANTPLNKVLTPVLPSNAYKATKKVPYTPPTTSENLDRFLEASCDCC